MTKLAALSLLLACARPYALPLVVQDKAVRESLAVRPYSVTGNGPAALTSWDVQYDFSLVEERGVCRLKEPHVELSIQQSYPTAPSADPATAVALLSSLDELQKHEDGHLRIDRAAAHELADALRAISPESNCERVREKARLAAARAIAGCRSSNDAYDSATRHGLSGR
jgi:predicted secreted Zn-dependent protease